LEIDESSLTGENDPVVKSIDTLPDPPPSYSIPVSDRRNTVFMGTLVTHGSARGIVVATGDQTEFGLIHSSLSTIAKPKTPLQQSMDHLGKQLSYVSFVVIGVIVVIGMVQGRDWLEMTTIGVSLAVAAIPEGLPIIVTVTLALGVLRMAGKRVIIRRLSSVETLGSVNVVCSDKTGPIHPSNLHLHKSLLLCTLLTFEGIGTLTLNHMTITKIYTLDTGELDVDKSIDLISSLPNDRAAKRLLRIGRTPWISSN
jgi:P-type Ca2+ transporter type 2C